jgi:hypothetical protein
MADIELIIKIPEEAKQAFDCAESNDLKGCYYDHGGVVGNAIKNGTPLPKGHGRLIDADKLNPDSDYEDGIFYAVSIGQIDGAETVVEAESEE